MRLAYHIQILGLNLCPDRQALTIHLLYANDSYAYALHNSYRRIIAILRHLFNVLKFTVCSRPYYCGWVLNKLSIWKERINRHILLMHQVDLVTKKLFSKDFPSPASTKSQEESSWQSWKAAAMLEMMANWK